MHHRIVESVNISHITHGERTRDGFRRAGIRVSHFLSTYLHIPNNGHCDSIQVTEFKDKVGSIVAQIGSANAYLGARVKEETLLTIRSLNVVR